MIKYQDGRMSQITGLPQNESRTTQGKIWSQEAVKSESPFFIGQLNQFQVVNKLNSIIIISNQMQGLNSFLYYSFYCCPYPLYYTTPQPTQQVTFYPQNSTSEELPMLSLESLPLVSQNTSIKQQQPMQQRESPQAVQKASVQSKYCLRPKHKRKSKKKRQYLARKKASALFTSYSLKNGTSNLLRCFLRCLFQLKQYEDLVRMTFVKLRLPFEQIEPFYDWLASYGINTQIFIKRAVVQYILQDDARPDFKQALRIILFRFLRQESLSRILTTNRYAFKSSQILGRRVLIRELDLLEWGKKPQ